MIRFASLSDQPLAEDRGALDTLAADLVELQSVGRTEGWVAVITLVGHADSKGNEELNLDLSNRRAETIRGELVDRGVAEDDLRAIGVGSIQPLAGVENPPRGSDRRVEVEVELVAVSADAGG